MYNLNLSLKSNLKEMDEIIFLKEETFWKGMQLLFLGHLDERIGELLLLKSQPSFNIS